MNRMLRLAAATLVGALLLSACAAQPDQTVQTSAPAASAPIPLAAAASRSATPVASNTAREVPTLDPTPVDGRDYVVIPNGRPYLEEDGKIEVVEVFGYVCPACARFHPLLTSWIGTLPRDVAFRYVPAPFGVDWHPYARGFYVADAMGLTSRTHDALIDAIHVTHSMPGEGQSPSDEAIAKFYGSYGVDVRQFLDQMRGFATQAKVRRGMQFLVRSGVEGTPTLIVAGKYRVTGRTWRDTLRIASELIDRERVSRDSTAVPALSRRTPSPPPPPTSRAPQGS